MPQKPRGQLSTFITNINNVEVENQVEVTMSYL